MNSHDRSIFNITGSEKFPHFGHNVSAKIGQSSTQKWTRSQLKSTLNGGLFILTLNKVVGQNTQGCGGGTGSLGYSWVSLKTQVVSSSISGSLRKAGRSGSMLHDAEVPRAPRLTQTIDSEVASLSFLDPVSRPFWPYFPIGAG